jgi:hypothetical protein
VIRGPYIDLYGIQCIWVRAGPGRGHAILRFSTTSDLWRHVHSRVSSLRAVVRGTYSPANIWTTVLGVLQARQPRVAERVNRSIKNGGRERVRRYRLRPSNCITKAKFLNQS